ncbi:hypothetical protein C7999DRAFT_41165 [Corynascus novoguineensis]|uniref:Uncharacterized protein n=1 Tax=Corynascus novoguineensis TaxID=1126955 RepID=A0AAN7CUI1_9PEZI|nr:hypothetical protein C7999DRAFT_41165 [Corynascus novoguineensis]
MVHTLAGLAIKTLQSANNKVFKDNPIRNCTKPVLWLILSFLEFLNVEVSGSACGCSSTWLNSLHCVILVFGKCRPFCGEVRGYTRVRSIRISSLEATDYGTNSINPTHATPFTAPSSGNARRRTERVSRRSHEKSKTGCQTCKRRRIKRVGFPTPTPQPSCDINMTDLELMHNFTTYTCATLVSDPAVRQFLRTTAVHMAVNCEYIMRSILAVSALHLSRYRPGSKEVYLERAMQHHQAATCAALQMMVDLRVEECERLHVFSMLTVYYALGCPVNEDDLTPESPLIPHWLRLLHGMEPILRMLEPQTYHGVLTPLFDFGRRRMAPFLKTKPPTDPALLVDFQSLIHRACSDPHLITIYDDIVEQLRRMLGLLLAPPSGAMDEVLIPPYNQSDRGGPNGSQPPSAGISSASPVAPAWSKLEAWDILVWQWTQGKDFLPLLESPSPPQEAVAIFAYCLLVLKKLESQWWVEGWADHLMGKTWAILDEEHRHWIGWATEEMGWIPPI